ncbi:hypothetical protein [Myroides injenensis]|uniref:hypothetical protein n=1 Tax=Myroides injenensis TaxID=1183151 RepID=UPI0002882DDD|nr:hypothetical protein [Myroides injenensis]
MKIILTTFLLLLGATSFAQRINGIDFLKDNPEYLEVIVSSRGLSTKLNLLIDYGQPTKLLSNNKKEMLVTDNNGNPLEFYSRIGIFNYMNSIDYNLDRIITRKVDDGIEHNYYIFRKKKNYPYTNTCNHCSSSTLSNDYNPFTENVKIEVSQ